MMHSRDTEMVHLDSLGNKHALSLSHTHAHAHTIKFLKRDTETSASLFHGKNLNRSDRNAAVECFPPWKYNSTSYVHKTAKRHKYLGCL